MKTFSIDMSDYIEFIKSKNIPFMKKQVLLNKIQQKKNQLQLKEAIHYTPYDSVIDGEETDLDFLCDVKQISEKKKSTLKNFTLAEDEFEVISNEQCDQIEEIAILHKEANIFNSTSMLQSSQIPPENLCECGCQRGKGDPFPLCMNEQNLAFLGPGVLLIFFYLKQIRWTLLLVFLTYGIFSLATNVMVADPAYCWELCESQSGLDLYICYLTEITSFKRKLNNQLLIQFQLWIGFIMCVIWIFSVKFIKHLGDKKNQEIDDLLDSASDYTVRIDNLPSKKYNEYDLIQYVKELWQTRQTVSVDSVESFKQDSSSPNPFVIGKNNDKQLKLRSIQLIYNMQSCRSMINQILNLSFEIAQCYSDFEEVEKQKNQRQNTMKKPSINLTTFPDKINKKGSGLSSNDGFPDHFRSSSILENIRFRKTSEKNVVVPSLQSKIKEGKVELYKQLKAKLIAKYNQLNSLRQNFLQDKDFRKQLSTTCALIQFESNEQQKQFLTYFSSDEHRNSLQNLFCEEKHLKFKNAHIKINRAAQPSDMIWANCQKQFSYSRYFIILIGAFLILLIAYSLIHFVRTSNLFQGSNFYFNAILVQLFNRIIWISLSYLVVFEYNNTKTESIISLMKKSITAQVINVIVSPLLFNFLINDNKIYGFTGLSGVVVIYQFIMFFMMSIFYVLNPFYYIKKIILSIKKTRNLIIRNLCEVVGEVDTIDEIKPVLGYYEGPQFPIAGGYVYMTTAIFHTLFYCHLEPIVILIAIINISGFLVIMKYILFRRCKIPQLTQIQIFDFAMFSVSCGAASYGFGSLYFLFISKYFLNMQIDVEKFIPSILCIMVWFLSSLNPFDMFGKTSQFMLKYLGFQQNTLNTQIEEDSLQQANKKRASLVEAGNLLLKIFAQEELLAKKAKRKQSYYQYSNVKKLLNYQTELKEVIIGDEEKNNIIFFCQSFCNEQKSEEFKKKTNGPQKKTKVNSPLIKAQDISMISSQQFTEQTIIIKRKTKTVPERQEKLVKKLPILQESKRNEKSKRIVLDIKNNPTIKPPNHRKRFQPKENDIVKEQETNEYETSTMQIKNKSNFSSGQNLVSVIKL